jgi:hypothetical protein
MNAYERAASEPLTTNIGEVPPECRYLARQLIRHNAIVRSAGVSRSSSMASVHVAFDCPEDLGRRLPKCHPEMRVNVGASIFPEKLVREGWEIYSEPTWATPDALNARLSNIALALEQQLGPLFEDAVAA